MKHFKPQSSNLKAQSSNLGFRFSIFAARRNGFTLIELLVVITITTFLLLAVSSMFMTILVGNAKTNIRKTLKDEGNYAMQQMEFLIRNGKSITCSNSPEYIEIISQNGEVTRYREATDQIASGSAMTSNIKLTSPSVAIDTLDFICEPTNVEPKYVTIKFTLSKVGSEGTTSITEDFSSGVEVRNTLNIL